MAVTVRLMATMVALLGISMWGRPLHLNAQNTSVAYNEFDFVIRLSTQLCKS